QRRGERVYAYPKTTTRWRVCATGLPPHAHPRAFISGEPYLQAGSPSEAPVTTGLVVLIPTPHENGLATCVCVTVAYQNPVPVEITGNETLFVFWNFRLPTVVV